MGTQKSFKKHYKINVKCKNKKQKEKNEKTERNEQNNGRIGISARGASDRKNGKH